MVTDFVDLPRYKKLWNKMDKEVVVRQACSPLAQELALMIMTNLYYGHKSKTYIDWCANGRKVLETTP